MGKEGRDVVMEGLEVYLNGNQHVPVRRASFGAWV